MESPAKKLRKNDGEGETENDKVIESSTPLTSLKNLKLKKVLNQVEQQKTIFLSAQVGDATEECVLILEKKPFSLEALDDVLSEKTAVEQVFNNDIYSLYEGFTSPKLNPMKVTMIYPATDRHIQKYSAQERNLFVETPELYEQVVLPHILEQQLSIQWLYNILDHKAESERILFEDPDPENGFILIPDLKWDGKSLNQLYFLAICHRRDIRSIRDLRASHLPILQHIKLKALAVLKEKYGLDSSGLRMYFHYQPSYYHLHIHICALAYEAPGIQCERGHLLETVLSNLNLMSDYYAKVSLTYALSESDSLYKKLKEKSVMPTT